jgi:protein Tex
MIGLVDSGAASPLDCVTFLGENTPTMLPPIATRIASELQARPAQIEAAITLMDEGGTVPFIARYRKEATGGLDDAQLRTLETRLAYLRELEARRSQILESVAQQGKSTPELEQLLRTAETRQRLEDLYLPYRPKRRTKAQIAREAGLEPLAETLLRDPMQDPMIEATRYLRPPFTTETGENPGVPDVAEALAGARWILMDRFSEDAELLGRLRDHLWQEGLVTSSVVDSEAPGAARFRDYFDHAEPIRKMPSHRALALFRGRAEKQLRLALVLPEALDPERPPQSSDACEAMIAAHFAVADHGRPADAWLRETVRLAWRAKIAAQLETHLFGELRVAAEEEAIRVFGRNLHDLLLAAPAGARCTIGLDPGIRTGVKVAVVDGTGKVLETTTIYPHPPRNDWNGSVTDLARLCRTHGVELIAIGNGTASRETDRLCTDLIGRHPELPVTKVVVSESGASVYSASEMASRELGALDVSLRGAVSIARRLQDPLAELVKIDPKAIGVGQYQHDVNQTKLARTLDAVVEDCVNRVGVDVNTASTALLSAVSGLSAALAEGIVERRNSHGPFASRDALREVPRFGPKTFEQAAGFLRIRSSGNPLDATAVHPEAYTVVERMLADLGCRAADVMGHADRLRGLKPARYIDDRFGLPTILDILSELEKPGRDPRPEFRTATFDDAVTEIRDLKPGMLLEGTVTNVTNFGAFVDVGVHQDGLVHISNLSERFVRDPREVVKAGDLVKVKVLDVDVDRRRIGLTLRLGDVAGERQEGAGSRQREKEHGGKPDRSRDARQRGAGAPAPQGALAQALARALRKPD